MSNRLIFVTLCLCLLGAPLASLGGDDSDSGLKQGQDAPSFMVRDLKGNKHMLHQVNLVPGAKAKPQPVYLIDFFGTWCKPCRALLPDVVDLQRKYASKGLRVLLVNHTEDRQTFEAYMSSKKVPLSGVLDKGGRFMALRFGVTDLPTTVLIGRDKKIKLILTSTEKDKAAKLRKALAEMMGGEKEPS